MTFMNNMWKKFKLPPSIQKDWTFGQDEAFKKTEDLIENFEIQEIEQIEADSVSEHLAVLKRILTHPHEYSLDEQDERIRSHLGEPEAYEILRQQRWPMGIHCPQCNATQIKRIPNTIVHIHRYQCLSCHLEFTDETGAPMEAHVLPINVWLHCWYLCGITDSITYIASRLQLDYATTEMMIEQLKKFLQLHHPVVNTLEVEWEEKAKELRKKLDDDMIRQYETLDANIAVHPKDTAEFRRQQNLRRNLNASTDPITVKPNAKKQR